MTGEGRPLFEGIYIYLLAAFVGYIIADLSMIASRPAMLPTEAPPEKASARTHALRVRKREYESITNRNILNSDGKIPPALASEGKKEVPKDGPATLSRLPLTLEGTIVHLNSKKSVASVNIRNRNETQVLSIDEKVPGILRITKIERRKVTFRNLANNRLEYIEIPKDIKINFGMSTPKAASTKEVVKRGEFDFSIKRSDLTKHISNLSSILNEARMVPNILPGSGGQVEGFRFVSINPGSIFEKLGFRPMDVIKSVNGDLVNSPSRAMEFYNTFKTARSIQLGVERNGQEETFSYSVTE